MGYWPVLFQCWWHKQIALVPCFVITWLTTLAQHHWAHWHSIGLILMKRVINIGGEATVSVQDRIKVSTSNVRKWCTTYVYTTKKTAKAVGEDPVWWNVGSHRICNQPNLKSKTMRSQGLLRRRLNVVCLKQYFGWPHQPSSGLKVTKL